MKVHPVASRQIFRMKQALIITLSVFLVQFSTAQLVIKDTSGPAFEWRIPLLDVPFMIDAASAEANRRSGGDAQTHAAKQLSDYSHAYRNLSMQQNTEMARNLHGSLYYGHNLLWAKWIPPTNTKKYLLNRLLANATALGTDYLAIKLPYGYAFQHEEFHRGVMAVNGIYSVDEVWKFGKGLDIAVTGVKDEDLVFLKEKHPAAQVRLSAAGVEGEYAFFQRMRKDNFFDKSGYPMVGLSILGTMHAINYVRLPFESRFNAITDSILAHDKTAILARDFTGYDFSAWVYDLFTPNEPYAARGEWPDGVGIKRPIKESDLTPEMKSFLRQTANMQYLNLVSPFMIGINRIRINNNVYGNFALRSTPTSFGYFAGGDFFLEVKGKKFFATAGINKSNNLTLPDLGIQFIDLRFQNTPKLTADAGFKVWLQPQDQLFFAKKAAAGASFLLQPRYRISSRTDIHAKLSYKTKGWQFANPYLDENFSASIGLSIYSNSEKK
jgi:hypothetical protein